MATCQADEKKYTTRQYGRGVPTRGAGKDAARVAGQSWFEADMHIKIFHISVCCLPGVIR